jgi:hypothetical protein
VPGPSPKAHGCCAPMITERSTTGVPAIRVPFSRLSAFPLTTLPVPASDLRRPGRWAKPSSATASGGACGRRSGLSWRP